MITIRDASELDIEQIAQLHAECIPYSINSLLGTYRLTELYQLYLKSENHDLLVAIDEGLLIGFISGSRQYRSLIDEARFTISASQFRRLCRHLGIISLAKMALEWLILDFKFRKFGDFYYFSTWGVQKDSNATAGSLLFRSLLKKAKASNRSSIVTNVSFNNTKVIRMYQSQGFTIMGKSVNELILKKFLK